MIRFPNIRPLTLCVMAVAGFASASLQAQSNAEATFAGGCFWCMEPPYDKQVGVSATISGYMGGELENPTYEQISRGGTDHIEVVQIEYDDSRIIADGSDFFRASVVIRSPLD
ncbi:MULTISPECIES: peptide-methionine (S)-S-oxide reductase [Halomonadaceae]|jgi:peptide-methionine (S)-S-oxide reductase|uniref:peptide-methionine (S)-S-oxide reductase n=1 Tax=Vreelandella aquamarina TaxID=77097 RepID=A0A1H8LFD4_9GAMM|nr:peptide-methionine (S)-S-oxide reductase [Halomonas meridiana]SEO03871.1 methionine-S-sulfoxide reductase [Halomonas aquamarina]|tara:strand:+ start:47 stop:385 length:339 start_codon:yes stop_codon:yes gene_type:complete